MDEKPTVRRWRWAGKRRLRRLLRVPPWLWFLLVFFRECAAIVLIKTKDKLKKEQTNGHVYHIPCAGANSTPCPGIYVGETERTVNARFQEHKSTASNALGKYKSAMLQHARDHNHHFRKEDLTVLRSEHDWVKQGIKESLYIKALKPSNIDPGRYHLSSHFDSILESTIIAPPPRPHNVNNKALINTMTRRQGRPCRESIQPAVPATQSRMSQQQP